MECFTQYTCGDTILHGDCSYRKGNKWYDWAVFQNKDVCELLGHIWFFFTTNTIHEVMAVISYIEMNTLQTIPESSLFISGTLKRGIWNSPAFNVVSLNTFTKPAFVIPPLGCHNDTFLIMKQRCSWSGLFMK